MQTDTVDKLMNNPLQNNNKRSWKDYKHKANKRWEQETKHVLLVEFIDGMGIIFTI